MPISLVRVILSTIGLGLISLASQAYGAEFDVSTQMAAAQHPPQKPNEAPYHKITKVLPELPLPSKLIKLPLVRQATDYTCGIGALSSVLAY